LRTLIVIIALTQACFAAPATVRFGPAHEPYTASVPPGWQRQSATPYGLTLFCPAVSDCLIRLSTSSGPSDTADWLARAVAQMKARGWTIQMQGNFRALNLEGIEVVALDVPKGRAIHLVHARNAGGFYLLELSAPLQNFAEVDASFRWLLTTLRK